jgi:replicative DNA helicase
MLDIVYIDYVGLIEVKAENRNLEISKITRVLKMLAMQLKIPIVILAQLSRAVEKRF